LRAALKLSPSQRAQVTIIASDDVGLDFMRAQERGIASLGMVSELDLLEPGASHPHNCLSATSHGSQVFLHVPWGVDIAGEGRRIEDKMRDLRQDVERSEKKLANPKFIENAPQEVVQRERERYAEARMAWSTNKGYLDALSSVRTRGHHGRPEEAIGVDQPSNQWQALISEMQELRQGVSDLYDQHRALQGRPQELERRLRVLKESIARIAKALDDLSPPQDPITRMQ
jgi:hypothetical protein